eukprot:4095908-Prymnesium_polylepis.1
MSSSTPWLPESSAVSTDRRMARARSARARWPAHGRPAHGGPRTVARARWPAHDRPFSPVVCLSAASRPGVVNPLRAAAGVFGHGRAHQVDRGGLRRRRRRGCHHARAGGARAGEAP